MKKVISILLFLLFSAVLIAQGQGFAISKTYSDIKIDGHLTEADWLNATVADNFVTNFPQENMTAKSKTEVWMTYNEKYLYIAAKCYDEIEGDYVVQSLKRDFSFENNDAFGIYLDPFQNANSGYGFVVNPFGVQLDGIIGRGGTDGLTTSWDGLWYSEVFKSPTENFWSIEIAIPLKTLRFNENVSNWKINFSRNDLKRNETSTWYPVPRDFNVATQNYMGNLTLNSFFYLPGNNTAVVPFSVLKVTTDQTTPEPESEVVPSIGIDAKIEVSPSLNLDLTLNPDFSQVEVDEQILNLNRFELFFPERRLFFLENSNQFSALGNSRVRPFFSRRIGGVGDEPVSVIFGARLSGNISKTLKVGLMNVQTESKTELDIPSQNWTVASLQKEILPGLNLGTFITNRQDFTAAPSNPNYNRIGGVELDYLSKDSKVRLKGFAHYSRTQEKYNKAGAYSLKARYRNSVFSVFAGIDAIGDNYITDMGYVPRLYQEYADTTLRVPYIEYRTNGYYRFYLDNKGPINYISPKFNLDMFTDNQGNFQEHILVFSLITKFNNRSELTLSASDFTTQLLFPFELKGMDSPINEGRYRNQNLGLEFTTNQTNNLYGELTFEYGGQFMGKRIKMLSELNYRFNKLIVIGLNWDQRYLLNYPEEYGEDAKFTLLGSKVEFSFSKSLFFSTFMQYNTQQENFNINSRFNWRFRPLSDLFLVYTENYTTSDLSVKDKTLVLKFSYWFNL